MKTFNFKEGTIEDLLKSRDVFEKLLGSIDKEKIKSCRWFQRKNMDIARIKLADFFALKTAERNSSRFVMCFAETVYADKTSDTYFFPLAFTKEEAAPTESYILVRTKDGLYWAWGALNYEPFLIFMEDCFEGKKRIDGLRGTLFFEGSFLKPEPSCEHVETDSTNSLVRMNYRSILKIIRKLIPGVNVEYEMGEFLTRKGFEYAPPLMGGINYVGKDGSSCRVGIKFKEIAHETDGFSHALGHLRDYFRHSNHSGSGIEDIRAYMEGFLNDVSVLAKVIAELHSTMRKDKEHPRFSPEKISQEDILEWQESFMKLAKRSIDDAQKFVLDNPDDEKGIGKINLSMDVIERLFDKIRKNAGNLGEKTRVHNDLHLAQVLKTERGFTLIDFEGEPLRSMAERAAKFSPLKDVAGILRSFHYAAFSAYFSEVKDKEDQKLEELANKWVETVSRHFFISYIENIRKLRCTSVPYSNLDLVKKILALYKLEKAIYELCYELNNRPLWVTIPVAGIHRCLKELEA